jgi:hypothetical protein
LNVVRAFTPAVTNVMQAFLLHFVCMPANFGEACRVEGVNAAGLS